MVVTHDETIDRVADGSGAICEMTCRASAILQPHETRIQGARIPTLLEVFEAVGPSDLMISVRRRTTTSTTPAWEGGLRQRPAWAWRSGAVDFNPQSAADQRLNPRPFAASVRGHPHRALEMRILHGMDACPLFRDERARGVQNATPWG